MKGSREGVGKPRSVSPRPLVLRSAEPHEISKSRVVHQGLPPGGQAAGTPVSTRGLSCSWATGAPPRAGYIFLGIPMVLPRGGLLSLSVRDTLVMASADSQGLTVPSPGIQWP
jgi:hypothetical protein